MHDIKSVLLTGGAGYAGAVLVPRLLEVGYRVKVLDIFWYGEEVLQSVKHHPSLTLVRGDIRDRDLLERIVPGSDAVIHLASISNDPSYNLNPGFARSINYDAFIDLVEIAKESGVRRFLFASSASVYGLKSEPEVHEDLSLEPLTDYSRYKALCEEILNEAADDEFVVTSLRPSTLCGYSPRMRLDLVVNAFAAQAFFHGRITVFGGEQKRPSLHVEDMARAYLFLLRQPEQKIQRKAYNVGCENRTLSGLAMLVRDLLGGNAEVVSIPTDDQRSYHVCCNRIFDELGFKPEYGVRKAVMDLRHAFEAGRVRDPDEMRYHNVRTMKALQEHLPIQSGGKT